MPTRTVFDVIGVWIRIHRSAFDFTPPTPYSQRQMNDTTHLPMVETSGLTRRFRSGEGTITVLHDVSIAVARGELVAIMGPSGSGKSTLLSLIAGLDRPSEGSVVVDGQAIEALGEDALALLRRRTIGFVFQSFHLLSNFTAAENVMLPLELLGRPGVRERARELLARVGLDGRGHHYPSQLSGGEQQRVAIARAFAPDPALLLADEPTGNLDGENGRLVLDLMLGLRRDLGTTLILITHDPALAALADRVIHLRDGRIAPGSGER
jgi:putative ABC transport system ATP-binding protein